MSDRSGRTTGYRIGIDVGGTFTDFVLARGAEEISLLKSPTTLDDQSNGVMAGITALARIEGVSVRELYDVDLPATIPLGGSNRLGRRSSDRKFGGKNRRNYKRTQC